jgi:predicted amidophosphoribosyltransferase
MCDYCLKHTPKILDKCCSCGKKINQTEQRFKRHGNWCGKCLKKISRNLKGYDGSYPYDEFLLDKINTKNKHSCGKHAV